MSKAAPETYQTPMKKLAKDPMLHAFWFVGGWRWRSMKGFNFHLLDYPSFKPSLPNVEPFLSSMLLLQAASWSYLSEKKKHLNDSNEWGKFSGGSRSWVYNISIYIYMIIYVYISWMWATHISESLWMSPWNGHRLEISLLLRYTGPIWVN